MSEQTPRRHRWGEPARFPYKTERVCLVCDLIKVTRHEWDGHWVEYWRDGEKLPARPDCQGGAEPQAQQQARAA